MVINQKIDDFISVLANPNAQTTSLQDNVNTFVQTGLTMAVLGLPNMVSKGFSPAYKDMMYQAALFPDEYIQQTNDLLKQGKIDDKTANETISVIKTLGEEAQKIGIEKTDKGLPIIQRQKRDLVIAGFR